MRRSKITTGVLMGMAAVGVAACTGGVSGGGVAQPNVPTISTSAPSAVSPPGSPSVSQPATEPGAPPATGPAGPAAQPVPVAPPEPALSGDCKAAELTLSIGQGNAAAGTVYRPLRFTNKGARVCTIQGFPGVSYVAGEDGHQVGPAAFRVGTKGPAISLAPGATVNAPVGFTQVRNFDPKACRPTATRGMRVYPPHDTAAMFLPLPGTGCAGNPPDHQLVVKTVQNGPGA